MNRNVPFCCLALVSLFGTVDAAFAQVCIDGLCFIDRGPNTVEINLGRPRGGVAVLDYDNDGFPDLVIGDLPGRTNRLYRNVPDPARPGSRTFLDVTVGSGLGDAEGTTAFSFGIVAADYDNDGDSDLFMTGGATADQYGLLYRNDNGLFTNVSQSSGLRPSETVYESASWVDFDLDGDVDLAVASQGFESNGANNLRLYRNLGDGTFQPAQDILPILPPIGLTYSQMWTDFDTDGYPDWFIPATTGPIVLRNVSDGAGGRRFADVTGESGFTLLGPAPMGIAAGDYDNDGDFDMAVSDAANGTYYENQNGFMALVSPFGTAFAWGITWLDADNDGDLDHYQCGRYGTARFDSLVRNMGDGSWQDVSTALNGVSAASQHTVQLDFNNDGRQDLITLNPGFPDTIISILENISTSGGHWVSLHLAGDGQRINRDAIGAVVRVTTGGVTQTRQVVSGSSTTATEDLRVHVGLGSATSVDRIEVLWPASGSVEQRTDVYDGPFSADQFMILQPRDGACCLCADQTCDESGAMDCAARDGVWTPRATCADVDCAEVVDRVPHAPAPDPSGLRKNRYISFVPGNRVRQTVIRVTLASLHHPDPANVFSATSQDYSAFEQQVRWVGPPVGFQETPNSPTSQTAARLQCQPYFTDWGEFEAVHVYGAEILPSSVYDIDILDGTCDESTTDESRYSEALPVTTSLWGDILAPYQQTCAELGCVPCNTGCRLQPNALDIVAVVDRFRNVSGAPPHVVAQLQGNSANPLFGINGIDIVLTVDAFKGLRYPYSGPSSCPP